VGARGVVAGMLLSGAGRPVWDAGRERRA
jgi:hypothetical protein